MAEPNLEQPSGQEESRRKPGPTGGKLIRRLIKTLREANVPLPLRRSLDSQILIACSGGLDSTALSVLITKYGQKIAPAVSLFHVDHGWRGKESTEDALWVSRLAGSLGVPFIQEQLTPGEQPQGTSLEEWARKQRKALFLKHAGKNGVVLTGHQADEVCETLIWRLFTGAAETHAGGILVTEGVEVRPLLGSYKSELRDFLIEEGQDWREDPTNCDHRFLRARVRGTLLPILDREFPRWQEHFLRYSKRALEGNPEDTSSNTLAFFAQWFGTTGVRSRRIHWEKLTQWLRQCQEGVPKVLKQRSRLLDSIDLKGGWKAHLEAVQERNRLRIIVERTSDDEIKGD